MGTIRIQYTHKSSLNVKLLVKKTEIERKIDCVS